MPSVHAILRHRRRQTPEQRWAEIAEQVAPFVDMTPEEHDELIQAVVRAAWQQLQDAPRTLEPEAPAPDFAAAWERLRVRRA